MTAACTFAAIPRSVTSGGSVRFFPSVSGFTKPIVTYLWDFGDGTSGAETAYPTPIHAYPTVAAYTSYDVTLTVTDSDSNTATLTVDDFIAVDAVANVPALPNDGTYQAISVLLTDGTNQMLVNRNPWAGSTYFLLTPVTQASIDKIGTMTFTLLDVGNSTAGEQSLIAEGVSIIAIQGMSCVFSGVIRRATQNTQNGFLAATKVRMWDIECDSDLARLKKLKVASSALPTQGETIIDSPGNIAQRILT